jgi:putative ATP-dependent endonuclease of OLD family
MLFSAGVYITLENLTTDTRDYFMKLPGHDTLRLILARRAILVEGPSDELIVQRAYKIKHGVLPLQRGIDIITVNSLAFKRFLEIADLLKRRVDVVTDNDGDVDALKVKYAGYSGRSDLCIQYDDDESVTTLEPQLLKANGLEVVNKILGTTYETDERLLNFMQNNKTECALRFFSTDIDWTIPGYIERAII